MDASKTRSGKIYSKQDNQILNKEKLSIFYTLTINYIDDKVERMIPLRHEKNNIKINYNTRSKAKCTK